MSVLQDLWNSDIAWEHKLLYEYIIKKKYSKNNYTITRIEIWKKIFEVNYRESMTLPLTKYQITLQKRFVISK